MPHRVISNEHDLAQLGKMLGGIKLPITVEWVVGRNRSLEQNRVQWMWANETAEQLGDRDVDEVRRDWKLRHGVPILRAASETFRDTYDDILMPLSYEQKMEMMHFMPITSEMKVPQMVSYLDAIQRECAGMGIELTQPSDDLEKYHARYRYKIAKAA